jgi:OOP family OmpA-OmpF porin
VSDDQDECKSEPGTLECKGCPDRDFDGVPDKEDKCPDEYGDYEEDGCPVKE